MKRVRRTSAVFSWRVRYILVSHEKGHPILLLLLYNRKLFVHKNVKTVRFGCKNKEVTSVTLRNTRRAVSKNTDRSVDKSFILYNNLLYRLPTTQPPTHEELLWREGMAITGQFECQTLSVTSLTDKMTHFNWFIAIIMQHVLADQKFY